MKLPILLITLPLFLSAAQLDARNALMMARQNLGPHPFPLPECPAGARLCDFFNGAYCFSSNGTDTCCDDGSGKLGCFRLENHH